ncbi:MAG: hypothetical protein ACRELF_26040 [Gemmataceae bacterium]
MRHPMIGLTTLVALTCAAGPAANAAALLINDASSSETITISANDFEHGLSINGTLLQIGLGSPASITLPETTSPITYDGSWIDEGLSTPGTFHARHVRANRV